MKRTTTPVVIQMIITLNPFIVSWHYVFIRIDILNRLKFNPQKTKRTHA